MSSRGRFSSLGQDPLAADGLAGIDDELCRIDIPKEPDSILPSLNYHYWDAANSPLKCRDGCQI